MRGFVTSIAMCHYCGQVRSSCMLSDWAAWAAVEGVNCTQRSSSCRHTSTPTQPCKIPVRTYRSVFVPAVRAMSTGHDRRLNRRLIVRIQELMTDVQAIHHRISTLLSCGYTTPRDPETDHLAGYAIFRQCIEDESALRNTHWSPEKVGIYPDRTPETEMCESILLNLLVIAAARRFRMLSVHIRVQTATRWINRQQQAKMGALNARNHSMRTADALLQHEMASITDQRILSQLYEADVKKGRWVEADPSIGAILATCEEYEGAQAVLL